jgi:energy-coupling factor transport system permease protein
MDSRGYGRTGELPARDRRITAGLLLAGLIGLCLGTYGLLDTSTPRVIGLPMLALGIALSAAGLALGGRRVRRTKYRPDPWKVAEWATAVSGIVAAVAMIATGARNAAALDPSLYPLEWPTLPLVPALGILFALLPAVVTPPPPVATATQVRLPLEGDATSSTAQPVQPVGARA